MTPKQTIDSVYDAFQRADIGYIVSLVAPHAVWKQYSGLPWGGDYTGPEGAAQFFTNLNTHTETTGFQIHETLEVGDEVISFGYYEGKNRSTGIVAGGEFMFRWKVAGSRIESYVAFVDSVAMMAALPATAAAASK